MRKTKKQFRKPLAFLLSFGLMTGMVCTVSLDAKSSDSEELTARKESMLFKAAGFLSASQNSDGSFGKNTSLLNESAEAVFVSPLAGANIDNAAAKKWLLDNGARYNNDTLARTAAALGDDALLGELLSSQNNNGGFGIKKNYDSDVLDSVLALDAINCCAVSAKADEGANIVYYLTEQALASGGWSYSSGSEANIVLTAMAEYEIARFMNYNNYSNSAVEQVLDSADSYLSENTACSFTDEEIENDLYAQIAHLEYNGKIDYKTIMDSLENVQSDDGGFYNSVHLTSLAVRLLYNMTFENTLHIYDLQTAVSPQNGYFGENINVSVNYAAAYTATMDTDCTLKLTVRNGKSVIYQKDYELTLSEDSTSVSGKADPFVINQMNDDGITVTTELWDGEKILRSSQKTITLEEVPVAGSTSLNGFTLTLDNYSAYADHPIQVTSECELLYATNVENSVDIRYTLLKNGTKTSEKTVNVQLLPKDNTYRAAGLGFTSDDPAGTVYTLKAECIYEGDVLAERSCTFTVKAMPKLPEPDPDNPDEEQHLFEVSWAGPVLSDYCVYAGSDSEITADARIAYISTDDKTGSIRLSVCDGENNVIAEKTQPVTLTAAEPETVQNSVQYPVYQTENMLNFTVSDIGTYKVKAELTDSEGNLIKDGEASVTVLSKPKQDLILNSDVCTKSAEERYTEYVDLSWNDISNEYETYSYGLMRKTDDQDWEARSIWNEMEKVRVLNVYPQQAYLKGWMTNTLDSTQEPAGMGLFDIDSVYIRDFNNNPESYMKDENGKWKYDVVFFGSSDCNSLIDLSGTASEVMHSFADAGRGILFGHDTICTNFSHYNFASFADDLGILVKIDRTVLSTTSTSVIKIGTLTNFPWTIRGTLSIPSCHSYGQYVGGSLTATEWMILNADKRFDEETGSHSNFYLVTNKNLGMIQTGHSNGQATDDERKVLANTLFYLYQRSRLTSARDNSFYDLAAPDKPENQEPAVKENTVSVNVTAKDNPTEYQYYITAEPETDSSNEVIRSNVVKHTALSGLQGYVFAVTDSAEPAPELITYDENGEFVQNVVPAGKAGSTVLTGTLPDTLKPYYIHIFAIDNAQNVSEEKIVMIGKNSVDAEISTDKAVYDTGETVNITTSSRAVLFDLTADAELDIYDENGHLTLNVNKAEAQTLTSSSEFALGGKWLIPEIYSGTYTARLTWSQNGEEIARAECSFRIAENGRVTNRIRTDKTEYSSEESISLINTVSNLSTNTDVSDLVLKVTVKDSENTEKADFTHIIPVLYLNSKNKYDQLIAANTLTDGDYTATADILDKDNTVISSDTTSFTVLGSSAVMKGSLGFSEETGNSQKAIFTVTNEGRNPVKGAVITVNIVNSRTNETVAVITKTADFERGQTLSFEESIDTAEHTNDYYVGTLSVTVDGTEVPLDTDGYTIDRTVSDPIESSEESEQSESSEESEQSESSGSSEVSEPSESSEISEPSQVSKPESTVTPDNDDVATGDNAAQNILFLILIMTASAAVVLVITEVKENAKKND